MYVVMEIWNNRFADDLEPKKKRKKNIQLLLSRLPLVSEVSYFAADLNNLNKF